MIIQLNDRPILSQLADGLVLCCSTSADADALAEFNSHIHSDFGFDKPDQRVGAWTRDLLTRPHPTFHAEDCTLVVEAASGKIISSMNLISQTWAYEGIPFSVGRPELVGTLPEYRKRGLVRLQFEEVHRWSATRGELVQGITGIPFYYKIFGYEMGLELDSGRIGYEAHLPKLKEGETEPFNLRPATVDDIPFLMSVYAYACERHLITCVRDETIWSYDLAGQSDTNVDRLEFRIIQRTDGEPVGYLAHPWYDWTWGLSARHYELKPGISWLEVTPSVARYLWETGGDYARRDGRPEVRTTYGFWFGSEHPSYDLFRSRLPNIRDPYAWYIRVPDLPAFLRRIAPALEQHIEASVITGHTGEIKISFYHSGLHLKLEKGKLVSIESWMPSHEDQGHAAFPDLSFTQLVFGYRTFDQLEQSYADCWCRDDGQRVLLATLFPKKASAVMMVN
jgi:hypothetical protein